MEFFQPLSLSLLTNLAVICYSQNGKDKKLTPEEILFQKRKMWKKKWKCCRKIKNDQIA